MICIDVCILFNTICSIAIKYPYSWGVPHFKAHPLWLVVAHRHVPPLQAAWHRSLPISSKSWGFMGISPPNNEEKKIKKRIWAADLEIFCQWGHQI